MWLSKVRGDTKLGEITMDIRKVLQGKNITVSAFCLYACIGITSGVCASRDLYVGNFFGNDSDILRYDGNTGAFVSNFVPGDSFPLGAAFGSDGNFYATNSNTDTVGKYNGTIGAFISTFASSVDDAAGLAFGPDHNVYVANSTAPGSVTKLNGMTGAVITTLT